MTTWEAIKKFYPLALFVLLIVAMIFGIQECKNYKDYKAKAEYDQKQRAQNDAAFKDSLTTEYNKKLKAWETSRDNYVVNELKDLKQYNQALYDQISKVKGDVIAYIDSKVSANLAGITAGNQLVTIDDKTNNYGLKFHSDYVDSSFQQHLVGISKFYAYPDQESKKWILKPDTTLFTTNLTTMNLKYGFKEDDKEYKVFVINSSPIMKINGLEGAYIIKKQPVPAPKPRPNFGFGPYIGFGLNTDYNLANPRFGWSVGVSVHYDIWNWHWGK